MIIGGTPGYFKNVFPKEVRYWMSWHTRYFAGPAICYPCLCAITMTDYHKASWEDMQGSFCATPLAESLLQEE
ncbi:MAG: hypothetical protein KJ052_21430 [Candidatus Hydrogenedentes bacterium]|nr:hypothetical protein [Candidatus Hydrogenedentota bacterium]